MIARIISGGQTGVDIAALCAAKRQRIPTGGAMPKGARTFAGPRPEWAREFGLSEHVSSAYPPRTYQNVADADATVRIAVDLDSPGERCTAEAARKLGKPVADIPVVRVQGGFRASEADIFAAAEMIQSLRERLGRDVVLNIAGNSERTAPGIERFAEVVVHYLIEASS